MADYLKAHGIEEGRILQESKSKTTQENIVNSKKLIAGDNASVGIITNDFHMFRALQIAHDNGLDEAQGIAAGSPPDMLVNNMVREFFAEINSCCPSSCKFRAWILEIASPAGSMSEGQLALRRGVRTTRQPLPFRQCGECGHCSAASAADSRRRWKPGQFGSASSSRPSSSAVACASLNALCASSLAMRSSRSSRKACRDQSVTATVSSCTA